jgi:isoaspartyl peptidase/L-asparaginase-like protein (Ntn-hydrolase superfamily)
MDGASLVSGAVAALPPFDHPIEVARAVLEDGRYQLLVAEGAARFAQGKGFPRRDPDAMITAERLAEFRGAEPVVDRGNTVGAVARDADGRLAAATSTGGIAGQLPGRVGDSPIVGAGTYADRSAACSCTGDGEAFARACAAFDAVQRASAGVEQAAHEAIARVEAEFGGAGGLILVDSAGEVGLACSAEHLPYAIARSGSEVVSGA